MLIPKLILLIFAGLFVISFSPAYAQHHSGSLAPPIDLDGLQVAVSTVLSPEDFSYGDSNSVNLSIRFFDTFTNVNIPSVTYRVQIFQDTNLNLQLDVLNKIFGNVPYTTAKSML